jgi:putative ABC transport system permease protein
VIFRDVIEIGVGNLLRMKLRASLTVLGVVIAIAAFVSMLSFGAGMQQNVAEQFDQLGLFSTMHVYPPGDHDHADTSEAKILDGTTVEWLAGLPGVRLAYPFDEYPVIAAVADTEVNTEAQVLSVSALRTKLFSQIESGEGFDSDSARQVVITDELLEILEIEDPDSVIGKELILSVSVASFDSALVHVFESNGEIIWDRFKNIRFDSLRHKDYRERVIRRELGEAAGRFLDGFLNARFPVTDTLVVSGVLKRIRGRARVSPIVVPVETGRRFHSAGFIGDVTDLFPSLSSGALFQSSAETTGENYSRVTLNLEPDFPYGPVRDSVEARGYRVFSYAEEFDEIRKFFIYFNMGLGVVGLIALIVSSLGIVNTMVMSITERRREIGVLKSLGADEKEIRFMFLVESALIGSSGSILGILFGWLISRVISLIVQGIMTSRGIDPMELFALPIWLIVTAYLFGLVVSLAAGYYPASRAARVDPVEALRNE